ncbi:MAG TPA: RhuM family protein [Saprospiraceae bacterium]|nr:RhuM family protein [Saprospiraceae bacterium]
MEGNNRAKQDIFIAKNYLTADEIDTLNRLVIIFLETAELRAKQRKDLTMIFWSENVDRILQMNDRSVLPDKGSITNLEMEEKVREIYDRYDARRKSHEAEQSDISDLEELEKKVKKQKE